MESEGKGVGGGGYMGVGVHVDEWKRVGEWMGVEGCRPFQQKGANNPA